MDRLLKEIKELAEDIRKYPDDVDGIVDLNTSRIIELCNESLVDDYEKEASEMVANSISKAFLG